MKVNHDSTEVTTHDILSHSLPPVTSFPVQYFHSSTLNFEKVLESTRNSTNVDAGKVDEVGTSSGHS